MHLVSGYLAALRSVLIKVQVCYQQYHLSVECAYGTSTMYNWDQHMITLEFKIKL